MLSAISQDKNKGVLSSHSVRPSHTKGHRSIHTGPAQHRPNLQHRIGKLSIYQGKFNEINHSAPL